MNPFTRFTRKANDAVLRVAVQAQTGTVASADAEAHKAARIGWALSTPFALLVAGASTAYAAAECGNQEATNALNNFMGSIAKFAMALGGGVALLMFVLAALAFMADKPSKGMKMFKNCVIGLAVLGLGLTIKFVVLKLVQGGGGNPSGCIDSGNSSFK